MAHVNIATIGELKKFLDTFKDNTPIVHLDPEGRQFTLNVYMDSYEKGGVGKPVVVLERGIEHPLDVELS